MGRAAQLALGASIALSFMQLARAQTGSLADLSIEQLGQIRVISVSRQPQRLANAPASIYVITREDIKRAGVTTIPEALRLAPNLEVARINSAQYAISARGFNNAVGNKLLVMIDGRTIYTPLYSGVFWDQQDLLLEDIDRIEVISGPGATLWGANAVNGVINIITRPANETQGIYATAGGGNFEQNAAVRYGGKLGAYGHFRAYAKGTGIDDTQQFGGSALDGWTRAQAGFRGDWEHGDDRFTLQSDAYKGESENRGTIAGFALGAIKVDGANVLGRWSRQLPSGGNVQVQSYFDQVHRDDLLFFRTKIDTFDVELQHTIPLPSNNIVWGGGYRRSSDDNEPTIFTTFIPASRTLEWENLFAQDEIPINDRLKTTVGLKLENNDYTGMESMPNVRVAWKASEHSLLWGSVSRAVRAPARYDRDVYFPGTPPFFVAGGPNFVSEVANVYQIGYRAEAGDRLRYSVTLFDHEWRRLRSGEGVTLPIHIENKIQGPVTGIEAWATWRVLPSWHISAGLDTLDEDLSLEPDSTDTVGVHNQTLANDADYQWMLRSSADLPGRLRLDLGIRHSGALQSPAVPAYTAVDASLGWQASPKLGFMLTVQNAFDSEHPEYGAEASRSEIPRQVFLSVTTHLGD
ncbi:MAG TPA: TonB-dependent receptor [Gammaproteobacteria bacterium]|nr:TonB-dependent receptor [Gammaproteobacteria bacterium]